MNTNMNQMSNSGNMQGGYKTKKTPNPQNYKIVKCVNFDNCTS